jgi:CYTH domain-containing protein
VFATLPAAPLKKRRYKLDGYNLDQFGGALAGLELTEIEWSDDAGLRALAPPLWAGREVSDDARYQGGTLSQNGLPKD